MDDPRSPLGGSFFENLLGDFLKLLDTSGPALWEMVQQLAQALATEGLPEANVDPMERIRLEDLLRVAELHVNEITGLAPTVAGSPVTVAALRRGEWAAVTLNAWRPLLDAMTAALSSSSSDDFLDGTGGEAAAPQRPASRSGLESGTGRAAGGGGAAGGEVGGGGEENELGGLEAMLGRWAATLEPVLLAMQFGSTIGHLARTALAQYDIPIPRPPSNEIIMVPANISGFASSWSLPVDDVRMWVALSELTYHAVLARPHVRERIEHLVQEYIGGFGAARREGGEYAVPALDLADPSSLERAMQDPSSLLGEIETPAQRRASGLLEAVIAAMSGYTDHVLDIAGHRLIASAPAVSEALRRRRVTRGQGQRFVERLFGLRLDQAQYDRGDTFVKGVIERAGEEGLVRLWESAWTLPTPAELDAPGLWLERIELPEQAV